MQRRRRTTAAVAGTALALALVAGACSSDDGDDDAAPTEEESTTAASEESTSTTAGSVNAGATVEVSEFQFEPDPVTIAVGETVTWENVGSSRHTITAASDPSVDPAFKSPPVQPDSTYQQVFNEAGTFDYFCSIHPDRMQGVIVVE